MAQIIEAVYGHGVFRPLEPVEFAEGQRVALSVEPMAMSLAEAHRLRGYDAVQLAAALQVLVACSALGAPLTFVSADANLNAAAAAEGLTVDNPVLHP